MLLLSVAFRSLPLPSVAINGALRPINTIPNLLMVLVDNFLTAVKPGFWGELVDRATT